MSADWGPGWQGLQQAGGAQQGRNAPGASAPPTPPSVSNSLARFDPIIKRLVDMEENLAMLVGRLTGPQVSKAETAPTSIDTCILDTITSRVVSAERLLYQIENHLQSLSAAL